FATSAQCCLLPNAGPMNGKLFEVVDLTGSDEDHFFDAQSCTQLPSLSNEAPTTPQGSDDRPPRSAYLQHFEDALDTVLRVRPDYAELFTPTEHKDAGRFRSLSEKSKALYVRLFQRKGPWIRVDSMLGYAEVGSAPPPWWHQVTKDSDGTEWESFGDPACSTVDTLEELQDGELGVVGGEQTKGATSATAKGGKPKSRVRCRSEDPMAFYGELQTALGELIRAGFLDTIPEDVRGPGAALETTLEAVECCLKVEELKGLMKRFGGAGSRRTLVKAGGRKRLGVKGSGRSNVSGRAGGHGVNEGQVSRGKKDMLLRLRKTLSGQQTLWGARLPLVQEVERAVDLSLESAGIYVNNTVRVVPTDTTFGEGGEGTPFHSRSSLQGRQRLRFPAPSWRRQHRLVRVSWEACLLFRRALRLLYLTCDTGCLSSGFGAATVSVTPGSPEPPMWSPGLAVAFGKARYANYVRDIRTKPFGGGGREEFLKWEASVELRYAMGKAAEELRRSTPRAQAGAKAVGSGSRATVSGVEA
ncbi:unnamed protein product, partial [Discosporangium mesarthrocarpum]